VTLRSVPAKLSNLLILKAKKTELLAKELIISYKSFEFLSIRMWETTGMKLWKFSRNPNSIGTWIVVPEANSVIV
jgi:hypothetical protein